MAEITLSLKEIINIRLELMNCIDPGVEKFYRFLQTLCLGEPNEVHLTSKGGSETTFIVMDIDKIYRCNNRNTFNRQTCGGNITYCTGETKAECDKCGSKHERLIK